MNNPTTPRTLGSARASRAGDGALAIANLCHLKQRGEGAATSTRGRVRSAGDSEASRLMTGRT